MLSSAQVISSPCPAGLAWALRMQLGQLRAHRSSLTPAERWLEPTLTSAISSGEVVLQQRAPETLTVIKDLRILEISVYLGKRRKMLC